MPRQRTASGGKNQHTKLSTSAVKRSDIDRYFQKKVSKAIPFAEMPQSDQIISNITIIKFFHQLAGGNHCPTKKL